MLLTIDIGNTNVVYGFLPADGLWHTCRQETIGLNKTKQLEFQQFVLGLDQLKKVSKVVLSSVVPSVTSVVISGLKNITQSPIYQVHYSMYDRLPISIKNKKEIGTDLVCNSLAAFELYKSDCIVIDFGTALTFTVISNQKLLGVNIAPGLKTSLKALIGNAAQLNEIPLELPASVIGKDTTSAIQSGVLWGYVGLVEKMIERIEFELGNKVKRIATGGLSKVLEPLSGQFDTVDKHLTLEGLRLMAAYFDNQTSSTSK